MHGLEGGQGRVRAREATDIGRGQAGKGREYTKLGGMNHKGSRISTM